MAEISRIAKYIQWPWLTPFFFVKIRNRIIKIIGANASKTKLNNAENSNNNRKAIPIKINNITSTINDNI